MMITKMMKISLFVLVGMISGSSAEDDWCRQFDNKRNKCRKHPTECKWKPAKGSWKPNVGQCVFRSGLRSRATAPSFVSLEADVEDEESDLGVGYEDDVDDTHSSSVSGDTRGSRSKKYLRTN